MKITIKPMQGKPIEIEVSLTDTVEELKKKVAEVCKVEPENQKLIHYGKVLTEDSKKLVECNLKEKDFVVMMVSKVCLFLTICK